MNQKQLPLILDCDPGIDDCAALLYACKQKQFDLLGISVSSGNVPKEQGLKNTRRLLQLFPNQMIPVWAGAEFPRKGEEGRQESFQYVDARDTHGQDGLGEVYPDLDTFQPFEGQAVQKMAQLLKQHPHEIHLLFLGPLTTLRALQKTDPKALKQAASIHIMGGAHQVAGNCSPVAEYNFWCDPWSAHAFFADRQTNTEPPLYLYTLDATYSILFSPNHREFLNQCNTPVTRWLYETTRFYVDFHWKQERTLGCILNDPLLVCNLASDHPIVQFKPAYVEVVPSGLTRGESIVDWTASPNCFVSTAANTEKFYDEYFSVLLEKDFHLYELLRNKKMFTYNQ